MKKYKDYIDLIRKQDFSKYSILLIGGGFMGNEYLKCLEKLGIRDIHVVCASGQTAQRIRSQYGVKTFSGGFAAYFENAGKSRDPDLVIIAPSTAHLVNALQCSLENGRRNVLVEKPLALYSEQLQDLSEAYGKAPYNIGVAFNRVNYESYHTLKGLCELEGGILSCVYQITEWTHVIDFQKETKEIFQRWGIANTSHVLSMAHGLIGTPKQAECYQSGSLDWHPTGSIFVGSGVSSRDIPFTYFGNWQSAGRWGVEIYTAENAYRLIPLEKLFRCKKGTVQWEEVPLKNAFHDIKEGLTEQIASMLIPDLRDFFYVPSLGDAALLMEYAEKVFGYNVLSQ